MGYSVSASLAVLFYRRFASVMVVNETLPFVGWGEWLAAAAFAEFGGIEYHRNVSPFSLRIGRGPGC